MEKFSFDKNMPDVIQGELKKYLEPVAWLVPPWCHEIQVFWEDRGEDGANIAEISVDYEYRRACMTFHPCFLGKEDKQGAVLHELCHAFSCVLADYARETIKTLLPKNESPKFRQAALDELTQRHEAWVCDMAYVLNQKMFPKDTESS